MVKKLIQGRTLKQIQLLSKFVATVGLDTIIDGDNGIRFERR